MRELTDIQITQQLLNRLHGAEAVFFGLDVGRVVDHSALSALVRYVFPIDNQMNTLVTKYYCVYLHRYELGTPYEKIEQDASRWWTWADITDLRKYFIMDMTGVGAPVLEGIKRRRVRCIGVNITSGQNESNPLPDQYGVPKYELVTQIIRTMQAGRLKGYDSIKDWPELTSELQSFGYKMNRDTANITYESLDEKVHDDLVISVALAVWYGERVVPYRTPLRGMGAEVEEMPNPLL